MFGHKRKDNREAAPAESEALSQVLCVDREALHLVFTLQDTGVLRTVYRSLHLLQKLTDALAEEFATLS